MIRITLKMVQDLPSCYETHKISNPSSHVIPVSSYHVELLSAGIGNAAVEVLTKEDIYCSSTKEKFKFGDS